MFENSYLQVEGVLDIEGTVEKPAILKPSDLFPNRAVVIDNRGSVTVRYAQLINLAKQFWEVPGRENRAFELIDHSLLSRAEFGAEIAVHRGDGYSWFYAPLGLILQ